MPTKACIVPLLVHLFMCSNQSNPLLFSYIFLAFLGLDCQLQTSCSRFICEQLLIFRSCTYSKMVLFYDLIKIFLNRTHHWWLVCQRSSDMLQICFQYANVSIVAVFITRNLNSLKPEVVVHQLNYISSLSLYLFL